MNELLKVKIVLIKNRVEFQVLEQCESQRAGGQFNVFMFETRSGIRVVSFLMPQLRDNAVFIRGESKDYDDDIYTIGFPTPQEAEAYADRLHQAVQEFNEKGGFKHD